MSKVFILGTCVEINPVGLDDMLNSDDTLQDKSGR